MKILVPLRNFEQIDLFSQAGADEYYFGFFDSNWEKKFGTDINRMSSMGNRANSFDLNDICEVVNRVHALNKKCYITLNANTYKLSELQYVSSYVRGGYFGHVDGIIVSDPRLVLMFKDCNYTPVMSTMAGIYNTDIAECYYKMGVRRMILPRELSINEIRDFALKYPDVDFEVFGMRDGCMFSDSNCLCVHNGNFGGICSFLRKSDYELITELDNESIKNVRKKIGIYNECLLSNACGLCAIYDFVKMNIGTFKIVGRADRTEEIMKDIMYVKDNISIATQETEVQQYLRKMRLPNRWKTICGLSCYYPEINRL